MAPSKSDILQGTLDLMVLKTLDAMGPMHGYGIARRIEQMSEDALQVNQGTIYLCLIRLVQKRWIRAEWGTSGKQPQGEVLFDHQNRPETARCRDRELGAHLGRHRAPASPRRPEVAMFTTLKQLSARVLRVPAESGSRSRLRAGARITRGDDGGRQHPPRHDARRGAPRSARSRGRGRVDQGRASRGAWIADA